MAAGKLYLNVSAGSSAMGQMVVFNSCDTPINIETGANINSVTNQTTPTVVASPGAVVLTAREQIPINVTVNVPANATPGTQWVGGVAAIETANKSNANGATLQVGVRETIIVTALPPLPVNYLTYVIPVIIVVLIVVLIIYLILHRRKTAKGTGKKPAATKKSKPEKRRKR
jgi:uncharacterized membrane protein